MEKPYELKALGQKILDQARKDGLQLAEDAIEALAKASYLGMKEWLAESAAKTATPIDDVVVKFTDYADQLVLDQIAKIDLNRDGK